jgi:hypothetical protein
MIARGKELSKGAVTGFQMETPTRFYTQGFFLNTTNQNKAFVPRS